MHYAADLSLLENEQDMVSRDLERKVPESFHDMGSSSKTAGVIHATDDSEAPRAVQERVQMTFGRATPEPVHVTS